MQNGADAFVPPCLLPSLRLRSRRVGLTLFRRALVLAFESGTQPKSEIRGDQLVGTFSSASVNLHGDGMDQVAVRIERSEKTCLVSSDAGLDSPQRILIHKKRSLHRAVMPPKPHGAPCRVVGAASIGKEN
jgi:hypothetical protein